MAKTKVKLLKDSVVDGSVEWAGTEVSVDDQTLARLIQQEAVKPPPVAKESKEQK